MCNGRLNYDRPGLRGKDAVPVTARAQLSALHEARAQDDCKSKGTKVANNPITQRIVLVGSSGLFHEAIIVFSKPLSH